MDAPAHASVSPKECAGLVLCHPLSHCAALRVLGTAHWLQTVWLNLAEGEQASVHGPPQNACPCCPEISALAVPSSN